MMANCHGCGHYIGDYSAYRLNVPGKGEVVLCYKCKRWAERHPGQTRFPPREPFLQTESRRVRTFANIYMLSALGLFAFGAVLILASNKLVVATLFLLGAISLFLVGMGMRRFLQK